MSDTETTDAATTSEADVPAAEPAEDLSQLTKAELEERASQRGIETRSGMTKDELVAALSGAQYAGTGVNLPREPLSWETDPTAGLPPSP